jgi:Phage integrase, N-terminal SAM-like domain
MGDIHAGRLADDRRTKFADYLDRRLRWWESEDDIKPSTQASYREAIELYFKPGLGHLRLADLRDHHFRDLAAAMRKINTPAADGDLSDLLRRLLDARATRGGKRISTRPLTDARIRRIPGRRQLGTGRPGAVHAAVQPGGQREGREGAAS